MAEVVVLGAAGMLGHKVLQHLTDVGIGTVGTVRQHDAGTDRAIRFAEGLGELAYGADGTAFDSVAAVLDSVSPRVVVNCIGVVKQRPSASSPIPSIQVNSLFPHLVDEWCRVNGAVLIHFSTDCVFSGDRGGYRETDPPDAADLYGQTKYLGEVRGSDHALTVRTSIIGRELSHFASLVEWFYAQQGGAVSGFTEVQYSGITTVEAARIVADLIARDVPIRGLYQVAGPWISKADLLTEIRDQAHLDIGIVPDPAVVSDRTMYGDRFVADTGISIPSWSDMISDMVNDPTPYGVLHA